MKLRSILVCTCLLTAALFTSAQTPAATGTGTTNYITRWLSATAQGNSVLYQNTSGWIGINTTTPKMTFDVANGNLIARGIGNFTAGGNQGNVYVGDTAHGITATRGNNAGYVGGTGINTYQHPNALFVSDNGNVGIGVLNPQYNLDLGWGSNRVGVIYLRDQYDSSRCLELVNYGGSINYYYTPC